MTALKLRHASTQDQTPATVSRIVNLINDAYRWSEAELWVDHKERTNALEITALIESGMIILAKKMMTLNAYFSASGIITFKNSIDLQETFKMIENDKILIETDSPFLAPIPMRGKKNEPSFIKYTLEKLSELKSKTFDELETITNDNFERLFFQ